MLICPKENFRKKTVTVETVEGHYCVISVDDIQRSNFSDLNNYATILLKASSPLALLLGKNDICTYNKVKLSEFYLGYDITQDIKISDEQYEWCEDFLDKTLYEARYKKPHPYPLPPFPK